MSEIIITAMDVEETDDGVIRNRIRKDKKKKFESDGTITNDNVIKAFNFAYTMAFDYNAAHRKNRSGGSIVRKNKEIFVDTFHGKLAEFAVYERMIKEGLDVTEVDLETYGLNKWDDVDFKINNMKVAVKSTKFFGNLLLLETKDWDLNGKYIPNPDTPIDYIVLVRFKPYIDIKDVKNWDKVSLQNYIVSKVFKYDFAGVIGQGHLNKMVTDQIVIRKGNLLGDGVEIDAENYYCQAGDMRSIERFLVRIKKDM